MLINYFRFYVVIFLVTFFGAFATMSPFKFEVDRYVIDLDRFVIAFGLAMSVVITVIGLELVALKITVDREGDDEDSV